MGKRIAAVVGVGAVLMAAHAMPAALGVSNGVDLVSVDNRGRIGDNDSDHPVPSRTGRYVAFSSFATRLIKADSNGHGDIFVRDREAGRTSRVSIGGSHTQANAGSSNPAISASGRYVAFSSEATNLVRNDRNARQDVFIRDRTLAVTERASVTSSGEAANDVSSEADLSGNGRFVGFSSYATNLAANDPNSRSDVFLRDLDKARTRPLSVTPAGRTGNGGSWSPSVNSDGRYVAFLSSASDLIPGDTNGSTDVFVRDRQYGVTTRVSLAADGAERIGDCLGAPDISADGRFVAFATEAALTPEDTDGLVSVYVRDLELRTTRLVSVSTAGTSANAPAGGVTISGDGRYVAFTTRAGNLAGGDTDGRDDLYVRDTRASTTVLASRTDADPGAFTWDVWDGTISGDGMVSTFAATDLGPSAGDANGAVDVFTREW